MNMLATIGQAFKGFNYALCGATAANQYMPPRATADIDFCVLQKDSLLVEQNLRNQGWSFQGQLVMVGMTGTTWLTKNQDPVDVLYIPESWGIDALKAAANNILTGVPVVTLPFLVFMKLLAARSKDSSDVEELMVSKKKKTVQEVELIVKKYGRPEDLDDFKQIIRLSAWRSGELK